MFFLIIPYFCTIFSDRSILIDISAMIAVMKTCFLKQYLFGLLFAAAVGGTVWLMKSNQHNTVAPLNFALINSTKIKNEAEPFLRVRTWFEKQCQNTQGDLSSKVQDLQRTYEWLKIAPKDQKNRSRHDGFRKEVSELERIVQERKEHLTQQFGVISSYLEEKLKQVIAKLARDKNISIVMNQHIQEVQAILYANQNVLDLTDDVIAHMNQETKNLHLPEISETFTPPEDYKKEDKAS